MAAHDIAALALRVEQLSAMCAQLSDENAELHRRLDSAPDLRPRPAAVTSSAGDQRTITRRGMLGRALGAAAAGVAGVALLEPGSPAAATDADAVKAGLTTTAEHGTQVRYDGASPFTGVVLLANDSTYTGLAPNFPAALGGWSGAGAHGGAGAVPNGIYGFTEHGEGHAIVGEQSQDSGSGGSAVYSLSHATTDGAEAVRGEISSTNPGALSAAVRGENKGTGSLGIGVHGSHAGAGWGVSGTAPVGIGVRGSGATGVTGTSSQGRGGVFSGPKAQIQLKAGNRATHPTAGSRGDLYVDKNGRLWFCKHGGAQATWKQLA